MIARYRPDLLAALRRDVEQLADAIGERHLGRPERLAQAADWIAAEMAEAGYAVEHQAFTVDGHEVRNLVVTIPGVAQDARYGGALVIGAPYDTVPGTPGADDNATGVAVLLAIARAMRRSSPKRTVRLVATDTAPFRNPHYHEPTDTPATLDFEALTDVALGFIYVVERLGRSPRAGGGPTG